MCVDKITDVFELIFDLCLTIYLPINLIKQHLIGTLGLPNDVNIVFVNRSAPENRFIDSIDYTLR